MICEQDDSIKKCGDMKLKEKVNFSLSLSNISAHDADSIGFLPKFLTITTLPHSDLKTEKYVRSARFGAQKINLTIMSRHGVPYGVIPRRILAWICAEAVRKKSPVIRLGKSQAVFLKKVNLTSDNSKNLARFKDQAKRLFSSTISVDIENRDDQIESHDFEQILIANKASFLWSPHKGQQELSWQGELTLSTEFFNAIIEKAIPIDMRIISKLSSALSIDLYVFLCWRFSYLTQKSLIQWNELKNRLGSNYPETSQGMADFKANAKKKLKEVLLLQDNFQVSATKEGLLISPSHLRIEKRENKKMGCV